MFAALERYLKVDHAAAERSVDDRAGKGPHIDCPPAQVAAHLRTRQLPRLALDLADRFGDLFHILP